MIPNWTLEVVIDFIASAIILIAAILSHIEPKTRRIKSLLFIKIAFLFMVLFMCLDGLTILFLNEILSRINAIVMFFTTTFLIIGINYAIKESITSISFIINCFLGGILCYLIFQPGMVETVIQFNSPNVNWVGFLELTGMLIQMIGIVVTILWGLRTYFGSPFLIRKEALIFLNGILIIGIGTATFYILYYFNPIFIIYSNLMLVIGTFIYIIAILREPKLLYILPFTVYRITVKDRNGSLLYDHDWSEMNIDEKIFTGFLNAVQLMSVELMNVGGLLDINLENGILIVNESKFITVGLVSSKSSKLLRECVVHFSKDFEVMFERELQKSIKDPSKYGGAFDLIEKYFSNFPSKIVKSRKEPLILAGKYAKIPLEIENKLKTIFPNEKALENIKKELLKSPLDVLSEFFNLYNNIKEDLNRLAEEKSKKLEDNTDNNLKTD